ncbi:hypothetical protein EBT31_08540 [bacterium]|nr:hypothetical protein [bacterium]
MNDILKSKLDMDSFAGVKVSPKLQTLLTEMLHSNPNFNFVASGKIGWAPDTVMNKVNVFDGAQAVGNIQVLTRDHDQKQVYHISTDRIHRKRGSTNTKVTQNLKNAMGIIKDFFKPIPIDTIAEKIVKEAADKIASMHTTAGNAVRGALRGEGEIMAMEFFYDMQDGKADTSKLPDALVDKGMASDWREKVHTYRVMASVRDQFKAKNGALVRVEKDGSLSMIDLQTKQFVPCKTTYDLPTNYQEKITMLKIVDVDQPIEHIGVRYEDGDRVNQVYVTHDVFFLIGGDTFTDC